MNTIFFLFFLAGICLLGTGFALAIFSRGKKNKFAQLCLISGAGIVAVSAAIALY